MKAPKIEDYYSRAAFLKALAHPTRLGVLLLLGRNELMSVTDLKEALACEQTYISQHLRQLKLRGILGTKRKGKFVFYFLKDKSCVALVDIFELMDVKSSFAE